MVSEEGKKKILKQNSISVISLSPFFAFLLESFREYGSTISVFGPSIDFVYNLIKVLKIMGMRNLKRTFKCDTIISFLIFLRV